MTESGLEIRLEEAIATIAMLKDEIRKLRNESANMINEIEHLQNARRRLSYALIRKDGIPGVTIHPIIVSE